MPKSPIALPNFLSSFVLVLVSTDTYPVHLRNVKFSHVSPVLTNHKKMLYMPLPTHYDVFCRHSSDFYHFKTSDIAIDLQALTCVEMPSQQSKKQRSSLSYD